MRSATEPYSQIKRLRLALVYTIEQQHFLQQRIGRRAVDLVRRVRQVVKRAGAARTISEQRVRDRHAWDAAKIRTKADWYRKGAIEQRRIKGQRRLQFPQS